MALSDGVIAAIGLGSGIFLAAIGVGVFFAYNVCKGANKKPGAAKGGEKEEGSSKWRSNPMLGNDGEGGRGRSMLSSIRRKDMGAVDAEEEVVINASPRADMLPDEERLPRQLSVRFSAEARGGEGGSGGGGDASSGDGLSPRRALAPLPAQATFRTPSIATMHPPSLPPPPSGTVPPLALPPAPVARIDPRIGVAMRQNPLLASRLRKNPLARP